MSEPIVLYDGAGNTLTVYARSQADKRLATGQWFATEAEAQASQATAEEVKADAAGTSEAAPAPKAKRPAKGKDA